MPDEEKGFWEVHYRNERPWGRLDEVTKGKTYLWVYGFFDYYDFLGNLKRMGFLSRWDSLTKRFFAQRNPNYDYLEDRKEPIENPFAIERVGENNSTHG